jgi:hypothetical protein
LINRRNILRAGALATLGAAGAVAIPWVDTDQALASAGDLDWQALERTLSRGATLYRPGDASFSPLSLPFNHRYAAVQPRGILLCATGEDVSNAIRWACERGIPVAPRSGLGHNYAGYSTTTGLLLTMTRMRGITSTRAEAGGRRRQYGPIEVAHDAGTVTVEAGVTNGDLHPMLEDNGMFVPTGRCPSVGVAGLVLGGGIGFSDKMFGLTCDRLVATTVVLADGSVVTCDESREPDLFWACRGGAGNNFGVHTSFTFTYEQFRGNVAAYRFRWSLNSAGAAMAAMQQIAVTAAKDNRFHCRLGIGTYGMTRSEITNNANVNALGQFYGTVAELTGTLEPLLRIGTPAERQANRQSIQEVTPGAASELLSATTPIFQFAAKSAILTRPFLPAQVQTVVNHVLSWPGSRNADGAGIALFGLGGRINQVPPEGTAFVHRDGLFVLAAEAAWADEDPPSLAAANVEWLDGLYKALFPVDPPAGAYQNFPDPHLRNWQRAYYGGNYERLVAVKQHYDPSNFFRYGQSIGSQPVLAD